jgi:predicted ester cyclase
MKLSELIRQLGDDEQNGRIVLSITAFVSNKGKQIGLSTIVEDDVTIRSNPPPGHFQVTNIYVDSFTRKTVVQFDNTPAK